MLVIGHRGSAGTAPENTLLGIEHGLASAADWIEIDVRQIDRNLFIIHDDTLNRTTDGTGVIYQHTPQALRQLDAGQGQQIPELGAAMSLINARAGLNIELKDTRAVDLTLSTVASALEHQPVWHNRLMVSSFEQSIHQQLSRNRPPGCHFGLLLNKIDNDVIEYAQGLDAYSINLSYKQLDPVIVDRAHAAGIKIFVYTVNTPAQIKRCLACSVDAIYTDYPARTIAFLNTHNTLI